MARHLDYNQQIDRGRKAGLRTSELYRAMNVRLGDEADQVLGQTDGNGFVASYDAQGRLIRRPMGPGSRS